MLSEILPSGALFVTSPFTVSQTAQIHAIEKEEKVKYKISKSWGYFFSLAASANVSALLLHS